MNDIPNVYVDLKKRTRIRFLILVFWLWLKNLFKSPLNARGVHLITGYPGCGKTLLMNMIIQRHCKKNEFYYSNKKQFDDLKTININILDLFENGTQIKSLPKYQFINGIKHKCKGLIFDEINASFNRRMNRTSNYNNLFVGLMQLVVTHRHQGIPRIYFLGQFYDFQDTQLQTAIKYRHDLNSKIRANYALYKETGKIIYTPKKIKIEHNIKSKDYDSKGQPVYIPYKKSRLKVRIEDLKSYNHLGYANEFINLPAITPLK